MKSPLVNMMETGHVADVLRMRADGTFFCADGSDPAERFKAWFTASALAGESELPVCIMHRNTANRIVRDAQLARCSAA